MPLNISYEDIFYPEYSTLLNLLRIKIDENIFLYIPNPMQEDLISAPQKELITQVTV